MTYETILRYAADTCGIPLDKLAVKNRPVNITVECNKAFTIYCNEGYIVFNEENDDELS